MRKPSATLEEMVVLMMDWRVTAFGGCLCIPLFPEPVGRFVG